MAPHKRRKTSGRCTSLEERINREVEALVSSGRYDGNAHAIYYITEQVQRKVGDRTISPRYIAKRIPAIVPSDAIGEIMSLENFVAIRDYLTNLTSDQLEEYGSPEGIYFLALDLAQQRIAESMYLGQLWHLVPSKKGLKDLIGKKAARVERWTPRCIDLRHEDAEIIVSTLKRAYQRSQRNFFARYGSSNGAVNLARDLNERGLDLNVNKVHTLIGDAEAISAILEIEDKRFETEWKPRTVYGANDEIILVRDHLRQRYEQDSGDFFRIYGGDLGIIFLALDMKRTHGITLNPGRIASMVRAGRALEELLEIKDVRFRRDWKPRRILTTLENIETMINFLKDKYTTDPNAFFARYGTETGALQLAEDLRAERELNISPAYLHPLVAAGDTIARLLDVKDGRFETRWKQKKMAGDTSLVSAAVELLSEVYRDDGELFFARYGSPQGLYYIAQDLAFFKDYGKRINLHELSTAFGKSARAIAVIGLSDRRFETKWRPRNFNVYLDTMESILDLLEGEYAKDPDAFFESYGTAAGTYRLAKRLKEEGIDLYLMRLGTVINKGPVLAELLGIQDDRFETAWKPRTLYFRTGQLEKVLGFLRKKYKEDDDVFFERYGSKEGQVVLGRELEDAFGRPVNYLNTLIGSGKNLGEILGIDDPRFESEWNPDVMFNSSDAIEDILAFLKAKYHEDPRRFFACYGRMSGAIDMARDLYKEKGRDMRLSYLAAFTGNGQKLAALLEIGDSRFKTQWHQKRLEGKYSDIEIALEMLRRSYTKDPDTFIATYGSVQLIFDVAATLEEKGKTVHLDQISLLVDPRIIGEQLGIKNEGLTPELRPRKDVGKSETARKIMAKLKNQYREDRDTFFDRYGHPLGKMILAKDVSFQVGMKYDQLRTLLLQGKAVAALLDTDDERFETHWSGILSPDLEKLALEGIRYLAEGRTLPGLGEAVTEDVRNYLLFRHRILRNVRKGERYALTKSANKTTIMHFVREFAPEHTSAVEAFVDNSIIADRRALEELLALPVPLLKGRGASLSPQQLRSTQDQVWTDVVEALDAAMGSDLYRAKQENPRKEVGETPFDPFCLTTGKLLYSFDKDVRQEAYWLLVQIAEQHPVYKRFLSKKGEQQDIAQRIVYTAAARYNPYAPFQAGKSEILSFERWLLGNLKWVKIIAYQKGQREVSAETGGKYEDEGARDGWKRVPELS